MQPVNGGGREQATATAPDPASVRTTTDLALAAYWLLEGLEVVKVTRRRGGGPSQDFVFHFADPAGRADALGVAWVNSALRRYDSAVRSLKKLCHENRGGK